MVVNKSDIKIAIILYQIVEQFNTYKYIKYNKILMLI